MATLRQELTEAGFDWAAGRILYQSVGDDSTPGWADPEDAREIASDDPILDREFDDGYGGPECPRFVAEDSERIYFPGQYDGRTWVASVLKDLSRYLDWKANPTPYVGG